MPARQKSDRPLSRQDFEARFHGDAVGARALVERRWPEGLVRPACGGRKGWEPDRDQPGRECADCRRQTPVTAATILQSGQLPLKAWCLAAHLLACQFNGLTALQLQA